MLKPVLSSIPHIHNTTRYKYYPHYQQHISALSLSSLHKHIHAVRTCTTAPITMSASTSASATNTNLPNGIHTSTTPSASSKMKENDTITSTQRKSHPQWYGPASTSSPSMRRHPLSVLNSLTSSKTEFIPISNDRVKMYVCVPTVYDSAHLG